MKLKIIISFIVLLTLIPLVISVPPQTSKSLQGLDIEIPQFTTLKQDQNFTFHTHVFNTSDGVQMFNDTTSCEVHVYNNMSGKHSAKVLMEFDDQEFEALIIGNNFSSIGDHPYILFCNTSVSGGFVSGNFNITPTGFQTEESKIILIAITITILLFLIVLFIYASILSNKIRGLKVFFWSLCGILIVILIGYILNVNQLFLQEYVNFNESISTLFVLLVTLSTVGGVVLITWLIFSSLQLLSKTRGTYEDDL